MPQWTLVWGSGSWLPAAMIATGILLVLLLLGYLRAPASRRVRLIAASLKALAILILAVCLLEPLLSGSRARPGANVFIVLADNSQSMTLRDRDATQTRAEQLKSLLGTNTPWLTQLRRDFDVREHAFDTQLRTLASDSDLALDGRATDLAAALERIGRRYQGRPVAGVLLFTDGIATDASAIDRIVAGSHLPPIYPVPIGGEHAADDIGVEHVAVTQTNFEDAPVSLTAQVTASGFAGRNAVAQLLDESGKIVQQQKFLIGKDNEPASVRFQLRPDQAGVSFYRVRVAAEGQLAQFDDPRRSSEATLANNTRLVAVDRGHGPYRVLYVSGRPNWEYKFIKRGLESDDQVQLVAMIRVAKREPKFNFLARNGTENNPLYTGFDTSATSKPAENYDQPVIVRLGTSDADELRSGFPSKAEDLFRYHAIILGDLEAEFFTQDQMQLLKEFVRQRGGGLLMLGGAESFKNGKYDRTPVGDLLPVYIDDVATLPDDAHYRLSLTREGWLEPWVRLRPEEETEKKRLDAMPPFMTISPVRGIKPGATILARVTNEKGEQLPALVEQRFGQGRVGAMLLADFWRWELRRPVEQPSDLEKAWRQTIRWLVAEVPQRVDVGIAPRTVEGDGASDEAQVITVHVRDSNFQPLDNATVTARITAPDGKTVELPAEPSANESGKYESTYVPRSGGAYRVQVNAVAPDASVVGQVAAGFTSDPAADEFRTLQPDRELLERIARSTGGQVVKPLEIEQLVASLPTRYAQITEPFVKPAWHSPWVFLLAIVCLCAEWGLRRMKGLP